MNKFMTNFTSSGNNNALNDIFEGLVMDFIGNFRPNFFKHITLDNKYTMKNMYSVHDGVLKLDGNKRNSLGKVERPNLYISFERRGNNVEDSFINQKMENPKKYPGAYGYDLTFTSYNLFYFDTDNMVKIGTSTLRNKVDFSMNINVNSKADQEELMSKIDSDIKQSLEYALDVKTTYLLPKSLIYLLKDIYFHKEMQEKKGNSVNFDDKMFLNESIENNIENLLNYYSKGGITRFISSLEKKGHKSHNNIYQINPIQRILYKFEKFEPQDGEKRGNVIDKFVISASGSIELENITNYVIEINQFVNNNEVEEILLKAADTSNPSYPYHISKLHKRYEEEREEEILDKPDLFEQFDLFMEEMDIRFETNDNKINILDWIKDDKESNDNNFRQTVFLDVYDEFDTDLKSDIIYIEMHENNKLMKKNKDYTIDYDKLIVKVRLPNPKSSYSLKLYTRTFRFINKHKQKHMHENPFKYMLTKYPR